jgi:GTP-binding protein
MMNIQKGKTEFLMGIDKVEQLRDWLAMNPTINGIAFIGRSNVGKSSMINALFGKSTARVSKTPGRTRQVNIFSFIVEDRQAKTTETFYLFDVPGYGHAEVSKEMAKNWDHLLGTFFELCSKKVALLNIQDARHPLMEADLEFYDFMKGYEQETYLVFNKLDKLKTQSEKARLKNLKPTIQQKYKWVKEIHYVSAEKGDGLNQVEAAIINFVKTESAKGIF